MRTSLGGTTLAKTYLPGDATWYATDSPTTSYSGVFEDDGQTAYFYAYDRADAGSPILDGLHIYNVRDVTDRGHPSTV